MGSFFLLASLPLTWGGFADALLARLGIGRRVAVLLLAAVLAARWSLGANPVVSGCLAGLPVAVALAFPPQTRLRRLGSLTLPALFATGTLLGASTLIALKGPDPSLVVPLGVGTFAGGLAIGAESGFLLGAQGGLLASLLFGPSTAAEMAFQTVWAAALAGGWVALAVERGLILSKRLVN